MLAKIAEENGLPADEATDVLLSRKYKDAVDEDWRRCAAYRRQRRADISRRKYLMVGAQPYEELQRLIEHVVKSPYDQTAVDSGFRSKWPLSERDLRKRRL